MSKRPLRKQDFAFLGIVGFLALFLLLGQYVNHVFDSRTKYLPPDSAQGSTAPAASVSASTHAEIPAATVSLPDDAIVYITATGEKFHAKADCGTMNPDRAISISLQDALTDGYTACRRCFPEK